MAARKTRAEIQEEFVRRFHLGEPSASVSASEIAVAETALNTNPPVAFKEFCAGYGKIYAPFILDEIVDAQFDFPDAREFWTPQRVIEDTLAYWSGGMPDDLIGFASDCMGNVFGFLRSERALDDAPVVFFDHDYMTVREVATSFDEFLSWYLDHLHGGQSPLP